MKWLLKKLLPKSQYNLLIRYWEAFFYSFPVRLIALQLQHHPFLMLAWLLVYSITGGGILKRFGGQYQTLEPEYLGEVGFLSYMLVGAAVGAFIFAYSITLYINSSYRYHFLVVRRAPFFTFVLNNALIPGFFLLMYFYRLFEFELHFNGTLTAQFWKNVLGFTLGGNLVFGLLFSGFFATSKNIFQYFGESIQQEFERQRSLRRLRFLVSKAKEASRHKRVDNFLILKPFGFKEVDDTRNLPLNYIIEVLNQHHGNSLLLQFVFFVLIIALGLLSAYPVCQVPVGTSGFLTLALLVMIGGALTFWVRKMGFITFLLAMGAVWGYYHFDFAKENNHAFGLDYQTKPARYDSATLARLVSPENLRQDHQKTLEVLNKWKDNYQKKHKCDKIPRAVFVCATGGGMRSSLWVTVVLQRLDSLSKQLIWDETRLMTGASGGMIGLAYMRELMLQRQQDPGFNLQNPALSKPITRELLNRVFFQALSDVFLPNLKLDLNGKRYDKEKGYAFDKQLMEYVPQWKGKTLADYRKLEEEALTPQMIISPGIINQNNQLFISPLGVSYLAAPCSIDSQYQAKIQGVEFGRMFAGQQADSLWYVTALRMNCTFPFVLPLVSLPSQPEMRVIDAGVFDNYGMITATKYLYEFRDWFNENVEQVVFVSIKDNENNTPIHDVSKGGVLSQLMSPLGGAINGFKEMNAYANEYQMQYIRHWYKGKFHFFSFEYPWNQLPEPATLSFRLTELEKRQIPFSLDNEHNSKEFVRLQKLWGTKVQEQ